MSRIIHGEPYKMVSTPSGVVGFGPFGQAKVDEETYGWLKERVKAGKVQGVFLDEGAGKAEAAPLGPEPGTGNEPETDLEDVPLKAKKPAKKGGKKKAK